MRVHRCTEIGGAIGDLQRGARFRALLQHARGEAGEAGIANGIGSRAASKHQAGGDKRQARSFAIKNREAIRKLEFFWHRKMRHHRRTRSWRFVAPGSVGIYGFAACLGGALGFRRRRGHFWAKILLARHSVNNHALVRIQLSLAKNCTASGVAFS